MYPRLLTEAGDPFVPTSMVSPPILREAPGATGVAGRFARMGPHSSFARRHELARRKLLKFLFKTGVYGSTPPASPSDYMARIVPHLPFY